MSSCNLNLHLVDFSIKQALDSVNYVMIESHLTFIHVEFVIMGMENLHAL
jgi:hypothetical protein